ncbi:MAG: polysaccharide deacetylase family protein [Bacteroidetes bacterium]|nr:polysaccharide deacetylase family protein [Bacteroidota bacterium]
MTFFRKTLISIGFVLMAGYLFAQQNMVCFTIDDLPLQRPSWYDAARQKQITENILSALTKYHIPAIGFVNEDKLYVDGKLVKSRQALLEEWLAKGFELGNHSYSHPNYDNVSFSVFRDDVIKGQQIIGELGKKYNKPVRYFRQPFLHTGDTREKSDSLSNWLKSYGLIEAPVTIDNSEWVFAFAYDSVLKTKDTALLHKIGDTYISYMEDKLHYFEKESNKLFGRNIRHVLLFHANALNGDYLDKLAQMFVRNQYTFISLDQALKDKAYLSENNYFHKNGISWLDRWALTKGYKGDFFAGEPLAPEFVKKLAKVEYE